MDYLPISRTLAFNSTTLPEICVPITLLSDAVAENQETFFVIGSSSDSSVRFLTDRSSASVSIIDNESKLFNVRHG